MKLYEAKNIIQEVFENGFDKEKYTYFIKNLLKDIEAKPFGKGGAYKGHLIPQAYQNVIKKMERIGKFKDREGNIIDILVVELKKEHSLEYARTSQRNFIRWYLNGSRGGEFKDAALVAFYTENSHDWRFSLIKMQYSLIKGKDEFTPAKRSSFLVGEKGKSHTAQKQLLELLKNDEPPYLSDLEKAFSIETVTDEFFEKYKTQLFNLKDELDKIAEKDIVIKKEFEQKNIDTLNFAKKLLGQIVFLYFLQKKGWLGLKEGQSYGEGDRNFMRNLFEQAKSENKNFFNDYLEFLFYDALSKKRPTDFYERFNCRIPFLNGGLFDPINFYDWEKTDIVIPNELFSNKTYDNEEGTGILDIFDLYNFTVKEDEPLETEVAIDPEMLGKVFERMLEVKERKSKGAFYTPREIVHYMAQQSLIYYLEAELNKPFFKVKAKNKQTELFNNKTKKDLVLDKEKIEIPRKDIETFVIYGEQIIDRDIAIKTGKLKESNNKYQIPESISKNAEIIDKALENIKICDPAVGSGAFPVGVMNEIVKLRTILTPFMENVEDKKERTSYCFKANAIQNSIYGVDIDAGAVEIAKLRLWLSMVVDESNINRIDPLPNLEYKIVCGNSLINIPKGAMSSNKLKDEIKKLTEEYFTITDKKEKQRQKQIIDKKIQQLLKSASEFAGYDIDFDFRLYFHEVFNEKGGFDIVIGNPPYVSTKGRNETSKSVLKSIYGFADDLYNHFFFKSFDILKQNCILSFITSNTFLTIGTKKNIRILLQKHRLLELIKTADVFDAMVSPAITIAQKIEISGDYEFLFKDAIKDFNKPNIYKVNIELFRNAINKVFFLPTDINLRFYQKYNSKIQELYRKWWPKIETSKKIAQNKNILEEFRKNIKPGDLVLLGLVTDGGVGLQTGNNGRFVGVKENTKQAQNIIKTRPKKLFETVKIYNIQLNINSAKEAEDFLNSKTEQEIWEIFDDLKEKYGRDIFGQGYIFRIAPKRLIADVDKLTDDEKKNGIDKTKPYFVPYDKGDKDGNRWYLETPFVIDWSKESVKWLKSDPKARWQGYDFYFREGFCWSDVHTIYIKARLKGKGVHDVKSMSLFPLHDNIPEYFIISLLNSSFISEYVNNYINNTQTFQINDARQLPIIVPNEKELKEFKNLFERALNIKKKQFSNQITKKQAEQELDEIQNELDKLVLKFYGIR